MIETTTIDLQGLSCPEPALKTKKALKGITGGSVEIFVDSGTARDNVERIGRSNGWNVTIEELAGGGYKLLLEK